jgi:hypothetical protein
LAGVMTVKKYGWDEDQGEAESELWRCMHGCTNPRHLVVRGTKVCNVAPDIFSITSEVLFPYIQNCVISFHTEHNRQLTVSHVTPELWVLGMQLDLCHNSSTKNLEVSPRFFKTLYTLGASEGVQVLVLKYCS